MQAVIETGGKQYKVQPGDVIFVEKLPVDEGATVVFDKVLAVVDGDSTKVGNPYLDGVTVSGSVVKNGKARKILVFKYKAKKNYRRKQGHRQPYTKVQIDRVGE